MAALSGIMVNSQMAVSSYSDGKYIVCAANHVWKQDTVGDFANWTDLTIPVINNIGLMQVDTADNVMLVPGNSGTNYYYHNGTSWSGANAIGFGCDAMLCDDNGGTYFARINGANIEYKYLPSAGGTLGSLQTISITAGGTANTLRMALDYESGDIWFMYATSTLSNIKVVKIGGSEIDTSLLSLAHTATFRDVNSSAFFRIGDFEVINGDLYGALSVTNGNGHLIFKVDPKFTTYPAIGLMPDGWGLATSPSITGESMCRIGDRNMLAITLAQVTGTTHVSRTVTTEINPNQTGYAFINSVNEGSQLAQTALNQTTPIMRTPKGPNRNFIYDDSGVKKIQLFYTNSASNLQSRSIDIPKYEAAYNVGSATSPVPSDVNISWVGGKVQIDFTATDAEDDDVNVVRLSGLIQYSDNNGGTWNDCNVSSLSGDIGVITASSGGTSHVGDLFFDFFKQLPSNTDISQFKIRMKLDDGNSSSAAYVESTNTIALTTDTSKWSSPHIDRARLDGFV